MICGNTDKFGANIDRFALSKSGRGYLNYLKGMTKTSDTTDRNDTNNTNSGDKRKRPTLHQNTITTPTEISQQSDLPVHKKCHNTQADINGENKIVNSTTNDLAKPQMPSETNNISTLTTKKKTITFQQVVLSNTNQTSLEQKKAERPCLSILSHQKRGDKTLVNQVHTHNKSKEMVKFIDMPTTTVALSTVTADEMICKATPEHNLITRLSDTQIRDITYAVTLKYDSVIKKMQEAHETQMKSIVQTQKLHDNEINHIKTSQNVLRMEMQDQLDKKMNMQNLLLHSMVTMIQDIKNTKLDADSQNLSPSNVARNCTGTMNTMPTMIYHSQGPDISYSTSESEQDSEEQDGTMTAVTVQSMLDSSQEDLLVNTKDENESNCIQMTTSNPNKPENNKNCKDDCVLKCQHVNKIITDTDNDIHKVTLTTPVDPITIVNEDGWNDVSEISDVKS
jgi:hypothetical protein